MTTLTSGSGTDDLLARGRDEATYDVAPAARERPRPLARRRCLTARIQGRATAPALRPSRRPRRHGERAAAARRRAARRAGPPPTPPRRSDRVARPDRQQDQTARIG